MAEVTQADLEAKVAKAKVFVDESSKILADAAAAAAADSGNGPLAKELEDARTLATEAPAEVDKAQADLDTFLAGAKADAEKAEAEAKAKLPEVEAAVTDGKRDLEAEAAKVKDTVFSVVEDFTGWVGTQLVNFKKGTVLDAHVGPMQYASGAPVAPVATEAVAPAA